MPVLLNIAIVLASSVTLVKGTSLFINSVSKIAQKFRISGYTISFFLVALGTSLPETVVAITSALNKTPILSFGDAMGSNVALLTVVVAIPAVLTAGGISTRAILNSKDIYFASFFAITPLLLVLDGIMSRFDGVILLFGYFVYSRMVLKRATGIESIIDRFEDVSLIKQLVLFIFSLGILLGASHLIVSSALEISTSLGIGLGIIGLTFTALGTSLPEIAFSVAAIKRNKTDEILGDIVGSVVANSTLVLGTAATIYPINVRASKIGFPTLFLIVFTLLVFLRFSRSKERLDTLEGVLLFFLYLLFVGVEFLSN